LDLHCRVGENWHLRCGWQGAVRKAAWVLHKLGSLQFSTEGAPPVSRCMAVTKAMSEQPQSEKSALVASGHGKGTNTPGEEAPPMASKKWEVTEKHKPGLPFLNRNFFTVSCFLVVASLAYSIMKMEAVCSSKMLASVYYWTTWHHIPEDSISQGESSLSLDCSICKLICC
jgi:hypothetical protein